MLCKECDRLRVLQVHLANDLRLDRLAERPVEGGLDSEGDVVNYALCSIFVSDEL